jgi:uncharacterized membrane protein YhhN
VPLVTGIDGIAWILALGSVAGGATAAAAGIAGRPRASRVLKMMAASGYVALALHLEAAGSPFGRLLLLALALPWLGDLCLTGDGRRALVAGLTAFLLAHLAFSAAFAVRGVALALGTAWPLPGLGDAPGRWAGATLFTGAVAFAASDILVARHRLVEAAAVNRLVGLPLYMLAQVLLVGSMAV